MAAIEDGQHPLQGVKVGVVHQLYFYDKPLLVPTVLSEAVLEPHRVTDARCSVVHAPYPIPYPSPPTVTLFDDMQRLRQEAITSGKGVRNTFATFIDAVYKGGTSTLDLGLSTSPTTLALSTLRTLSLPALGSVAAYYFNLPLAGLILLRGISTYVEANNIDWSAPGADAEQFNLLYTAFTSIAYDYVNLPLAPPYRKTKFTLAELAATIESLAMVREFTPEELEEPHLMVPDERSAQYKKEQTVWNWLMDESGKIPAPDTRGLAASNRYTSQIHVRIDVDDSLGCEAPAEHHEIRCARDDRLLLAAASAGSLEDLARLHAAIIRFGNVLKEAIGDYDKADSFGYLWLDRAYYNSHHALKLFAAHVKKSGPALQGGFRLTAAAFREAWINSSDPFREERKNVLQTVWEQLYAKLMPLFFGEGSAGLALNVDLQTALAQRRCPVPPSKHWVRTLPQRASAGAARSLFSAAVDDSVSRVDVQTEGVLTRMYSEYHDASAWFSASMKTSRTALRRYVAEWEASSLTRVRLTCVCVELADGLPPFSDAPAHSTLVLTTPADIRFSEAIAAPTEHAQRRIRLVVARTKGGYDKSVLEALGLAHSDASLLACQVFGDLWVEELRALWALADSKQAEMLERASARASARLRAAGVLLRELMATSNPSAALGDADVVALGIADPSLVATQPGRDAGLLLDRVLFSQNYLAVRVAMAPRLREAALVAVRAADAFERAVPLALPHEPVASLFGHHLDGVAAWLRVRDVAGADALAIEAATARLPVGAPARVGTTRSRRVTKPRPPNAAHRCRGACGR